MKKAAFFALLTMSAVPGGAADPVSFRVEVTGSKDKPAMILIPGLSSSGEVWRETVAHYQDRYQCHVLTLAGFAGVPRVTGEGPMLARVRDELAAYIREKKLTRPVIVGHSLGGFVAMWLAAKEPELPGPLVIVDSLPDIAGVYPPTMNAAKMRDTMAGQTAEQNEKFLRNSPMYQTMVEKKEHQELLLDWGLKSDRVAVAQAMYEMLTTDLRDAITEVRTRSLVLGTWIGMKSMATRESILQTFDAQYARLPNRKLVLSDVAKHFIMYDDRDWFFAQVDEFLREGAPTKTE